MKLHLFGGGNAENSEGGGDNAVHAVGELQAGRENIGLCALYALGIVEAVESGGQLDQIAVDAGGVVIAGGETNFLGEEGELLDELMLILTGELGNVHILCGNNGAALGCKSGNEAADAGVGVLNVVNGVLAVLADC